MSALWRTHSHLILLTIQAILLQLVWTQNKYLKNPTVGWIRLILLPISLGVLLSDFVTLRNDLQISPIVKVILASILASRIFKSILLAFNRPSPVRVIKSRESGVQPVQALPGAVLGLVLKSSSNPSKIAGLPPEGSKHTLRSDVTFLISTIRRMVVLNISGVIASYCWKGANDEVLIERYPKIKQYEPQVMAVAWGVLIWTAIDLGGCLGRLSLFTIKAAYRAMSFSTLFQQNLSHVNLSILDLEQTCPFIFTKFPLEASSITDFWSRHWQDRLKDLFVEAGAIPLTSLVIWACGKRKPHPKLLRLCGIIGAFTISAIVHEVGESIFPSSFGVNLSHLTDDPQTEIRNLVCRPFRPTTEDLYLLLKSSTRCLSREWVQEPLRPSGGWADRTGMDVLMAHLLRYTNDPSFHGELGFR
ncbi:hypothetical protein MJO28_000783 [Puccinia striiformis f. sp. tritici]|uniref:Wax synthase domain-containing protein n=2 Tax=Puccinia striiformis TaxID=27350 RepID=A0A2S4VDT1_9BASI|nr:hypothetical protein MJO28_000783 [Puccinia striiformis f. sp. tritici]POW07580.1 hypothetical protein PSTT_08204 [Puccinia striiformis]